MDNIKDRTLQRSIHVDRVAGVRYDSPIRLRKSRKQRDYLPLFYSLSHFPTFFEFCATLAFLKRKEFKM